jgi:putative tryptophan/tyrosine transport system substrate-binding protein
MLCAAHRTVCRWAEFTLLLPAPAKQRVAVSRLFADPAQITLSTALGSTIQCSYLQVGAGMQRREFIALFGGAAAAWPLAARAQQPMPVIGFLSGRFPAEAQYVVTAFEQGLREGGFSVGQNFGIEFRWAEGQYDRLPAQAADLVSRHVTLIAASGAVQAIQAAQAATSTVPIVFVTGDDPVRRGLVASMNLPGGNATGVTPLTQQTEAKRLNILHQLLPQGAVIAMLVTRSNPSVALQLQEAQDAARTLGRQLDVLEVANTADIDTAFATMTQHGDGAVALSADPFLNSHREQLIALTTRYKLPSLFYSRESVASGALMSYGASFADSFVQAGGYASRILKGEKAADLPILQATKFEFIINLKTAKALGLTFPPTLLALADEVIE